MTISLPTFGRRFQQLLGALDFRRGEWTLGCIRPGGATALLLAGCSVDWLRLRGRWLTPRSLEHYVQECASCLALHSIPLGVQFKLEFLRNHLYCIAQDAFSAHLPRLAAGLAPVHGDRAGWLPLRKRRVELLRRRQAVVEAFALHSASTHDSIGRSSPLLKSGRAAVAHQPDLSESDE